MTVKLTECPRDAMQGMLRFVDTKDKVDYMNLLLQVGFDVLDCGSFVSPKVIPQMKDTAEVLELLDLENTRTKLLVIVANSRGAEDAVIQPKVSYIGFPFSISETFQQRNTNSSITDSMDTVKNMLNLCNNAGKQLVVYISMAFGNPYNDFWDPEIVSHWVDRLYDVGVMNFSMADTVGVATPEKIKGVFKDLDINFPKAQFGAHFHSRPDTWEEKLSAAYEMGCLQFDGAIRGYGGCPMAKDELVGNMPMENMVAFFQKKGLINLNMKALEDSLAKADKIFK